MEALNLTKRWIPPTISEKILSGHQLLVIEFKNVQSNFFPEHLSTVKIS